MLKSSKSKLGLALAVTLASQLMRLSARRASRRSKSETHAIAEGINARIAETQIEAQKGDRQRQRRRLIAITVLVILVGAFGWLFLRRRPPIESLLRTGLPSAHSAVIVDGLANQPQPWVRAQLHALVLHSRFVQSTSRDSTNVLKLILPVQRQACRRLVMQLGGDCGGLRGLSRQIQTPMVITWPEEATVTINAKTVKRFDLLPPAGEAPRQPLSNWTLETNAAGLRLNVDCLERSSLNIIRTGEAPIQTKCVEAHPAHWRISFAISGERPLEAVDLIGLSSLHSRLTSARVRLKVDHALARLGDSFRRLDAAHGIPVEIESSNKDPVTTELAITRSPNRTDLSIGTAAASRVRISHVDAIPTTYHRDREIWLPVLFAVIGALATAWLDRCFL